MTEIDSKIQAKLGRISKNHTLKRNVSRLRYFYSKIINQSKLHSTQGTSSSSHTDEWIHAMAGGNKQKSLQGKSLPIIVFGQVGNYMFHDCQIILAIR